MRAALPPCRATWLQVPAAVLSLLKTVHLHGLQPLPPSLLQLGLLLLLRCRPPTQH
jgi:hypothetical protein